MANQDTLVFLSSADHRLELADGAWHFGDVRATPANEGDVRHQHWLVARPPGAPEGTVVLINVFTGTYAGVYQDEWSGDRAVKCAPGHLSAANIHWQLSGDANAGDATLAWRGDPDRVLARRRDKRSLHAVPARDGNDEDLPKRWRLEPTGPLNLTEHWPDWLARLPDDIRLSEINLPYTHQTLANHGISHVRPDLNWSGRGDDALRPWAPVPYIDNPRCQEASLWDQLQLGVRGLDIRLDLGRVPIKRREGDGSLHDDVRYFLYARHGLAEMGYSWSAVLLLLRAFLRQHPSEFILVNVRYERSTGGSADRTLDWLNAFADETAPFWDDGDSAIVWRWWQRDGPPTMTDLPLSEVRGKIILATDADYMPADDRDGRRRGARFFPHDLRSVGHWDAKRDAWQEQLQACAENLRAAADDRDPGRYFQTSLNVSGLPDPLKFTFPFQEVKQALKNPTQLLSVLGNARRGAENEVFDPIDFARHAEAQWRDEEHPLSERRLGRNGERRVGKVDLDFVNLSQGWVANVIRSNRVQQGREF